jgi:hypothetical protein
MRKRLRRSAEQAHGMANRSFLARAAMRKGLAPEQIAAEWRRRRNRLYAAAVVIVPCMSCWAYYFAVVNRGARLDDRIPALVIAALAATAIGCIYSLVVWRCPSCGRPPTRYSMGLTERLGLNNLNPSNCVHCGAVLRDQSRGPERRPSRL